MAEAAGFVGGHYRESKRIARAHDARDRAYYEEQMRSEGLDPSTGERAPRGGVAGAIGGMPGRLHGSIKAGRGGTVAGVFLGALAFFTLRAAVEGGWSGVRQWYAAKFLNKTTKSPNPVPTSARTAPATPAAPSITRTVPSAPSASTTGAKAILA